MEIRDILELQDGADPKIDGVWATVRVVEPIKFTQKGGKYQRIMLAGEGSSIDWMQWEGKRKDGGVIPLLEVSQDSVGKEISIIGVTVNFSTQYGNSIKYGKWELRTQGDVKEHKKETKAATKTKREFNAAACLADTALLAHKLNTFLDDCEKLEGEQIQGYASTIVIAKQKEGCVITSEWDRGDNPLTHAQRRTITDTIDKNSISLADFRSWLWKDMVIDAAQPRPEDHIKQREFDAVMKKLVSMKPPEEAEVFDG